MINKRHERFLIDQCHTDEVRHSGRTLCAHLCGTHDLLEAWGNSEPVCTAGLFHSIYGTNKFRHKAWPIKDRATVRSLIGPEAEMLAYIFCTADRPRSFLADKDGSLTPALREIEAANLIEQGSASRWLQRLRDSDISDGAKRAISQHLDELDAAVLIRAG